MKTRKEQLLFVLGGVLWLCFNAPLLFLYNSHTSVFGFPKFYVVLFILWLSTSLIIYLLLKNRRG